MEDFAKGIVASYRGIVQGVYYGTKIRLPHAAVMAILFQSGTLREKALSVAWQSFQHARNLAAFVGIYKGSLAVLRLLDGSDTKKGYGVAARPIHALAAGALGGYCVWTNYSSVNFQIVLYLFSRVLIALVRLAAQQQLLGEKLSAIDFETAYPYLAAGTWALVLWLYEV
jgi:peroxisomal membrane protein 4